jgi:hypothetical protein
VAKSKIPDPLARRHLIERELPADRALAIAEAYLADSRETEAIDFLAQAGAADRLAELRRSAIAAGDAFLLRAVAHAIDEAPEPGEWRELAAAAAAQGKDRYAVEAGRQADRVED